MIASGEELGAVLSNEDVAAAAAANDAIEALTMAWDGLKQQLVVAVLPTFVSVVEKLSEIVGMVNEMTRSIREFFGFVPDIQIKPVVNSDSSNLIADLNAQKKAAEELVDAQKKAADENASLRKT